MSGYCHNYVVCRLYVTRLYYDKTAEIRIMSFCINMQPNAIILCLPSMMTKFEGSPSILESK